MSRTQPAPPSRLAYALLFAMTVVSFGGPFLLIAVIGGGQNPKWPPDRPIEWGVFLTIVSLACVLLALCVSIRWWMPLLNSASPPSEKPTSSKAGER